MSAEEYIQGPASDDWDWDPCDWMPDAAAHGLSYTSTLKAATRTGVGTAHDKSRLDYNVRMPLRKALAKAPEDTACVIGGAVVTHSTDKALLITCDALNAPAWIPKSVVISYTPLTLPGWLVQKMLDADIKKETGDFESLCPYCGGQHCDCGTDI